MDRIEMNGDFLEKEMKLLREEVKLLHFFTFKMPII
jgi:hypothetical protein